MRTPGRITTIIAAGALATAATGAVAAAAGQSGTCDGTGAGRQGQQMRGQGQQMRGQGQQMRGQGQRAGNRRANQRAAHGQRLPARTNAAPLSTSEAAAVTYMREEEKLARDVYTKLAETAGVPVFSRIAVSEQRHMDAMGKLIQRYGIADPTAGKAAGEFQNAELQQLYNDLVAQGAASQAAAIKVGVAIEQRDIADLKDRVATSKHRDVTQVMQNLQRGSQNHLRAFTAYAG